MKVNLEKKASSERERDRKILREHKAKVEDEERYAMFHLNLFTRFSINQP